MGKCSKKGVKEIKFVSSVKTHPGLIILILHKIQQVPLFASETLGLQLSEFQEILYRIVFSVYDLRKCALARGDTLKRHIHSLQICKTIGKFVENHSTNLQIAKPPPINTAANTSDVPSNFQSLAKEWKLPSNIVSPETFANTEESLQTISIECSKSSEKDLGQRYFVASPQM